MMGGLPEREYTDAELEQRHKMTCVGCTSCLREEVARLEGEKAALEAALRRVADLIDYREHAFGQPGVEDADYMKSLHDTLPQVRAALSGEGQGWLSPEVAKLARNFIEKRHYKAALAALEVTRR